MRSFFTSIVTLVFLSACGGGGDNRGTASGVVEPAVVIQVQGTPSAIESSLSTNTTTCPPTCVAPGQTPPPQGTPGVPSPDNYSALAAKAIDLTDAIAILKMIVGLDVNSGGWPITLNQAYAADVDGNGKVELSDAISVLKRIVGLETMKADWMFFNTANNLIVMSDKLKPGAPPNLSASVDNPRVPNVIIYPLLRGDVISNSRYSWTLTTSPTNSTAQTIASSTSPYFYATTTGKYEAVFTFIDENFNSSQTTTNMVVCNSASNTTSPFSGCTEHSTSNVGVTPSTTPLSVKSTSYGNKNLTDLTVTAVPVDAVSGVLLVPTSVTFGDFFQEGAYSAFVVSTAGQAYFLRWQSASSTWVDGSATLFGTGARNTCNATYAITADFNADGKPDVFLSCSGLSNQLIFLSSGSSYVRTDTGIALYGNRAAAADINGDGALDLVLTDKNATPQIWKGILTANGTGNAVTFAKQTGWLSTTTCNGTTLPTNIDTVFLVPAIWDTAATANTNLILGGVAIGGGQPYVRLKKIDTDPVPPYYSACVAKGFLQIWESTNNAALRDIIYQDSKFYLLTQSTLSSQVQLSSYTVNTSDSPVFSATQRATESASGIGLPQQYKYNNAGYFQPYEAGCSLNRCAASVYITPP